MSRYSSLTSSHLTMTFLIPPACDCSARPVLKLFKGGVISNIACIRPYIFRAGNTLSPEYHRRRRFRRTGSSPSLPCQTPDIYASGTSNDFT